MYEAINSKVIEAENKVEEVEETIEISYSDEEELFNKSLELFKQEEYTLSKDILLDVISLKDKNVDAWALIGKILYYQEDINGAITFTRRALSIDSTHEEASELLIQIKK